MKTKINFTYVILFSAFSLVWNQNVFAQLTKEDKLDSLRAKFVKDSARIYRHANVGFILSGDKRNTFIHTATKIPVEVVGGQLGISVGEHDLGIGFYSISNTTHTVVDEKKTQNINLKMGYATVFYEYTFVDTRFWEIGFPVEVGAGNYQTTVTDSAGKRVPGFNDTLKRGILLLGAGLNVNFKILKWFGLNAMGGYRIVGGNEPNKVNFNGVFYSVGLQFYLGEFIREFRFHEKKGGYIHNVSMIKNPPPWD